MKVFDFNVHLPFSVNEDVNIVIREDMRLNMNDVFKALELHSAFIEPLEGANFLLFNTVLFEGMDTGKNFLEERAAINPGYCFTTLIDHRRKDLIEYMERIKAAGISCIMFNSYLQKIADADFKGVYKACKFAEENKMIICIDGSYGTSKMYEYDNLKLACFIADRVAKVPIVIIHSGGCRVLEAMLLAADKKNVWLDTSFSLPYYMGSSLEKDYAFAYKKIGTERVVYGSDYPYENSISALDIHLRFFNDHRFDSRAIEDILYNNAQRLFHLE